MRAGKITRGLFFVCFFGVGAAAFSISILSDDLVRYYRNKRFLESVRADVERLELLNEDYDALLTRVETDPDILKKIAPAVLGVEPDDANVVHPSASLHSLIQARDVLSEKKPQSDGEPVMLVWLSLCSRQPLRMLILLCGASLIILSFVWFGSAGPKTDRK